MTFTCHGVLAGDFNSLSLATEDLGVIQNHRYSRDRGEVFEGRYLNATLHLRGLQKTDDGFKVRCLQFGRVSTTITISVKG